MFTFMPYQRDCFSLDPLKVASFTPQNFTVNINASLIDLFPEKLDDFRECPLYVAPALIAPYTYMRLDSHGTPRYKGIDIAILVHISKALNFTIIYKRASNSSGLGKKSPNSTLTENVELVSSLSVFFPSISMAAGYVRGHIAGQMDENFGSLRPGLFE